MKALVSKLPPQFKETDAKNDKAGLINQKDKSRVRKQNSLTEEALDTFANKRIMPPTQKRVIS